jgi:hypothetical protein
MTTKKKFAPVPSVLSADTDEESVASELTDPLVAWTENLAKWNPCTDGSTDSESETDFESESDASSSSSSVGSSSEGSDSEENHPRRQPSLQMKQKKSRRKQKEEEDDFDPLQVILEFVVWLISSMDEGKAKELPNVLASSDQKKQHIRRNEEPGVIEVASKTRNVLLNERLVASGRHLNSSDKGETYYDHVVVATEVRSLSL